MVVLLLLRCRFIITILIICPSVLSFRERNIENQLASKPQRRLRPYSVVKVLWKETALPRCRTTDSRWNRSVASLVSSVTAVIRRPNSCTNSTAWWSQVPATSQPTPWQLVITIRYDTIGNSIYTDLKKTAEDKSVWRTFRKAVINLMNQQICERR